MNVGYSHPVEFTPEAGIEVEVPANTKIIYQRYRQRTCWCYCMLTFVLVRPPEPYKGKGIRYEGELYVVKKVKQVNNAAVRQ